MDAFNIKVDDTMRCREYGRMVTYHVRKVNSRMGLIEGVVLNDDKFMTSWFMMTFAAWHEMEDQAARPTES